MSESIGASGGGWGKFNRSSGDDKRAEEKSKVREELSRKKGGTLLVESCPLLVYNFWHEDQLNLSGDGDGEGFRHRTPCKV